MSSILRCSLFIGSVCLWFALAGVGCGSLGGPASASFASVTIENRSLAEITSTTAKVFAADGYRGGMSGASTMVFDKEASRATTLSREGVVDTYSGAQTVNRVKVEIVAVGETGYRLQCKAFVVRNAGDRILQEEVPLANIRSAPYQSLLNKVKKELK
jgi:hypothetical protein